MHHPHQPTPTTLALTLTFALALALTLTSALPIATAATAVDDGNRTQTIHIGNLGEPNDLDPHTGDSTNTSAIIQALFEGLTVYDPRTCEPRPGVAETWEPSPDGLTWTFHLRPNARWSNGDPVTAADFVYSFRRILMPGLAAEYASMLFVLKNATALYAGTLADPAQLGARAPDPRTLVLTLEHPAPYLPAMLCHTAWLPVHRPTIEKHGRPDQRGTPWTRPGNIVSNGAFTLADWQPNQLIRVVKNETYWDAANVRLHAAVFYPIENEDTEERMFRSGQLHVTATLPRAKIPAYQKDPAGGFEPAPNLGTAYYRFNTRVKPLDDIRVRRALAMSIARERIVKRVTRAGQPPAGHFCPPGLAGFTATAELPHDPAAARKLLAEAGYPGGKNFPHLDILYNTNEAHRQIAEAIQQMWRRELGIDIGLYNQEFKVAADSLRNGDYQIARFAWIADYIDPSTFLDIMTTDSGNNETGWGSPEYDRLIAEANRTPDNARRHALYQHCEQILVDDCPIAPSYYYVRDNLRSPAVKGWHGNPLDIHPLKHVWLEP
jgi:oligopeptide transport system substrate-binding protein